MFASLFYSLASPMLFLFSATYLWRQSQDPIVLAVYYVGFYSLLPVGFLVNGFFLRRFSAKAMYFAGCVLGGAVPMLLVSLGGFADNMSLLLGALLGLASGLYWGNRNFLTCELTVNARRFKYITVEWVLMIAAAVASPLIIGSALVFGERTSWYGVDLAYHVCAFMALIILALAGFLVLLIKNTFAAPDRLLVRRPSRVWNTLRLLEVVNGADGAAELIIPTVLLLLFVGSEDSIGLVQSVTAVLGALGLYILGKSERHDHARILTLWGALTFVGRAVFAWLNSLFGALVLFAVEGFVGSFRWASLTAVMYETVDEEQKSQDVSRRYAYIMDRESFLNCGRVLALLLFIVSFVAFSQAAIRFGMLFALVLQISMVLLTRKLKIHLHGSGRTSGSTSA